MKTNTIKTFFYAIFLFTALNACKKEEIADPSNDPETEVPSPIDNAGEPTETGAPIGHAITKNIGPDGGTIETLDKSFSITIPAGGFLTPTPVTIQPISNKSPNNIDSLAYRISAGAEIAKPATVKIKLTNDRAKANGEVRLAYQNEDKVWMVSSESQTNSTSQTVSATITELKSRDLSFISAVKMNLVVSPTDNTLLPLQPIRLQVWGIPEILLKDYPAGTWVPVKGPRILKHEENGIVDWYVNDRSGGDDEVGIISNAAYSEKKYSGDYGAPAYLPNKNPVNLSVDVKTKKGTVTLEKDIKIIQDNHIISALGTTSATNAIFVAPTPSLTITVIDNMNPDDPSDFTQGVGVEITKGFTGSNGSYRFSFAEDCKATLTDNVRRKAVGSTTWIDKKGNKHYSGGEVVISSYKKSLTNPGFAIMEGTITGTAYFIKEIGVYETEPFTVTFKCIGTGL